mmetsp:Transcript_62559/g.146748  ORF Transcript_62559/g.146748 Transcript_62559/m.146748 type:complete len:754 (+) Transcript_62559:68-2329(+)
MSKKVVTKKKAQPPPAATAENGAPPPAPATSDVRVAQQLRVLETVAGKGETDEKTYSPRTERHIQQLTEVLDFFQYSRGDIAALVRRCHYDEHQIQVAVANIVEDRANHEQEEWGTVKNKKQAKEERKLKEEEDKKEQERLAKEEEKQRKEAERQERKAAKEAREAERSKRGKGSGKNGESDMPAASLPPDPAILFAGTKPTKQPNEEDAWEGGGPWWENGEKWNKSWEWESWHDDWSKPQDDGWWGQWEKAGSRKKGYKEKKELPAEDEEAEGVLWDMPDTTVQPDGEAGLDQWTLGRLPVHEREGEHIGIPKALPENALTLEELERDHLTAAPTAPPVVPAPPLPPAAPQVSAPMPNVAPPTTKPLVDSLPPQQDLLAALGSQPVAASSSSVPIDDRADRQDRGEKGDKGRGKGKKGKGGERERTEGEKERLERIDRSDDPRRQAVEQVGEVVTVRKHSSMGCAVVSMTDIRVRQAIVAESTECTINNIKVQIKPHTNKETKEEVLTDLFVAWGRQVEKVNPLSEQQIAKYFDTKYKEMIAQWKAAEEEKLAAEERDRQQRLQEQAQQAQEVRERESMRRRYEEEELKRRQQEAAETQKKMTEQEQQKWLSQQWMQQAGAGGVAQTQAAQAARGMAAADAYGQAAQAQQRQQAPTQSGMQWHPYLQMYAAQMGQMGQMGQGWHPQMARPNLQMGMGGQEGVDMRAYWAQYMEQQRGQNAAYAQAAQQAPGGYQNQQGFNYNAAAYARGERI